MYRSSPELKAEITTFLQTLNYPRLITREKVIDNLYPQMLNTKRDKYGKRGDKSTNAIRKKISCTLRELGYRTYSVSDNNRVFVRE